ncbi:DUF4247 domain-containing protein [Paenibacillus montanisoli]|uniref:DUF4247 domain-containing protein n=1 Tax=Paenibacillus montanisoli TaxID=2081970 RepID=A0A328U670_9BACL|nr:DUF4247 domain-containing protein [Paenibacillus montanisoli]RAP78060.1 DUF4247 domain-containing protein [Paenibacillus montanisoli]
MRNKTGTYWIKLLLVVSLIFPLLAACGINSTIEENYPLESVNGSGSQTSYVYRAAGVSVPDVAKALVEQSKPDQQSPEKTDHMFLVYSDRVVHLQQDTAKPEDTLIEVDSKEYVRNNYDSSFLEGYLIASLIDDLFDHGRYGHGNYRGYKERDLYKPKSGKYRAPSADEKKAIPPMTVNRTGSIFKRSKNADSSKVGEGGLFNKAPPKSGKITRDSGGESKSGSWLEPRKSKKPKTRVGRGRVTRRR